MSINELCSASSGTIKNTGRKAQCLELPFRTLFKVKDGFSFASIADAKDEEIWKQAIIDKNIIPLYDIEEISDNETSKVEKEGRFTTYKIKDAIAGSVYSCHLSYCSHEALKSLENSGYNTVIRVTEDDVIEVIVDFDGTVRGIPVTYFSVGTRKEATTSDPATTDITLKYGTYEGSLLDAGFSISTVEGILDLDINIVSSTATEIKFTATDSCAGSQLLSLVQADVQLANADGTVVAGTSFVAADPNGEYTITGTGFVTGDVVSTVGVIDKSGDLYEGSNTITV